MSFVVIHRRIIIGDLKLSKELKEKLIGSDREGSGLGIGKARLLMQVVHRSCDQLGCWDLVPWTPY